MGRRSGPNWGRHAIDRQQYGHLVTQPYDPSQFDPTQPTNPAPPPPQYAPPPTSGQFYAPPKKPFWSSTGGILIIVFGVIGLVVLLCCGLGARGVIDDQAAASKMDVQLTECKVAAGVATVGYSVTNNGDETNSVRLKIEYRDSSGARLDTDTAYVRSVAPGDTARGEETTFLDATASSITCKIVDVS